MATYPLGPLSYNNISAFLSSLTIIKNELIDEIDKISLWDGTLKDNCKLSEVYLHILSYNKITFNANGGRCDEDYRMVIQRKLIGDLPKAFKSEYINIGWFLDAACTNQIQSTYIPTSDITCYAGYMKEYMTLERVGSTIVDPNTLIASNFSNTNYLTSIAEDKINFANGLEMVFRAKTADPSLNQEIFGMTDAEAFEFGAIYNKFMWEIASGSASSGTNACLANKWYYWKIEKNSNYQYRCYYADGDTITENPNWILDYGPVSRSATVIGNFALGIDYWCQSPTTRGEPWLGEIDVKNSYMKINGYKISFRIKGIYDDIYNIIYNLNGGINNPSNPSSYKYETPTITLGDPTYDGKIFNGWSPTNIIPYHSFGDKTFTASWKNPIILVFKVLTFGCTPTIKITINGELKYNAQVIQGENTISISTFSGLPGTIEISGYDITNTIVFLDGIKKESFTSLSFITKDDVTSIQLFLIAKEHSFVGIKDKIHEEKFIYSPGYLIGGFKYKFHWQSIYPEADKSENGKIILGHVGSDTSHKMHLKFGYKVNDGAILVVAVSYTNGTTNKIGYYENGNLVKATSASGKKELGAIGLGGSRASLQLSDYEINLTSYPRTDLIQVGIILKDDSAACAGIYFGNYKDEITATTKCTVEIIEE